MSLLNRGVLVTGAAGFIGYHVSRRLLDEGYMVYGIDNLNDYYDVELKKARLAQLNRYQNFKFEKLDIANTQALEIFFKKIECGHVVHLAAQAGVRYSLINPAVYTQSNLLGFANLLECSRQAQIEHFIYASTSSVYGISTKYPFVEMDTTDSPLSFYAATKKANEVMAYSYASLYKIPVTGLRFFTVYGPWGRPDMALFKFTDKILRGESIKVYNKGVLYRDFTYVDDIVEGLFRILRTSPNSTQLAEIYNIGFGQPVKLTDFIDELELQLGIKANKVFVAMQKGDMYRTFADVNKLEKQISYSPKIALKEGISCFLKWYKEYYKF